MYHRLPSWNPRYGASVTGSVMISAWSGLRSKCPTDEYWVASPPGVSRGATIVLTGSVS